MLCPRCRAALPDGANYCPQCGKRVSSFVPSPQKHRRRAKGTGSVYKLQGRRSKPWAACVNGRLIGTCRTSGEAVALLMPKVPVTTDRETAPTVTVDLPVGGSVKVEIPVEDVTTGTVAVLVKSNGD